MKIVGINGSPRSDGNTKTMIAKVFEVVQQAGIKSELVQVGATGIRGCSACYRCAQTKDRTCAMKDDDVNVNEIIGKMAEADGIILGSPTYFADITSELKALIDRVGMVARVNGHLFKRKAGAAVVALRRGGGIHAFDSINHFFQISGMFIVGSSYWNLGFGREKGEVASDVEAMETMTELGKSMTYLLEKLAK